MSDPFATLAVDIETAKTVIINDPRTNKPLLDENGDACSFGVKSTECDAAQAIYQASAARKAKKGADPSVPLSNDEFYDLLTAITASWHLVGLDGKHIAIECTKENARRLYGSQKLAFIREQVINFATDRTNYFPPLV